MKGLVLVSGGLDSATCLGLAVSDLGADNVTALSVYYGQKHIKELKFAEELTKYYNVKHKIIDLTFIFNDAKSCSLLKDNNIELPKGAYSDQLKETDRLSTYVPFRNGLILSCAAAIAASIYPDEEVRLYLGAHADDAAGDAYPDCRPDFAHHLGHAIDIGTYNKVKCYYPLIDLNKAGVVKLGLKLNVPYHLTWSCYEGEDEPCGVCGTCIDRQKAFELNGIKDPLLSRKEK